MKTPLKLNKKELISIYEKSNERVKKILLAEFGNDFFIVEKPKSSVSISTSKDHKIVSENKKKWFINWDTISDLTPIFRMIGYAYMAWLIL